MRNPKSLPPLLFPNSNPKPCYTPTFMQSKNSNFFANNTKKKEKEAQTIASIVDADRLATVRLGASPNFDDLLLEPHVDNISLHCITNITHYKYALEYYNHVYTQSVTMYTKE